jgi:hypothetical protein
MKKGRTRRPPRGFGTDPERIDAMNAHFETPKRLSAAGATTAAILILMLAMAVSNLFPSGSPAPSATATTGGLQLAQPQSPNQLKKS